MKRNIVLVLFLLIGIVVTAQQYPISNQYLFNSYSLSPVYAGIDDDVKVFSNYRNNWVGMENAPTTKMVSINGAISDNIGIGGSILSDQADIFKQIYYQISSSYHYKINDDNILSFGLWLGINEKSINLEGQIIKDLGDDVLMNSYNNKSINGSSFYSGAGLLYRFKDVHFGITIPSFWENSLAYEKANEVSVLSRVSHMQIHASYKYELNSDFNIQPFFVSRIIGGAPMNFDVCVLGEYEEKYKFGFGYRKGSGIPIIIGGNINDYLHLNYTYELAMGGISEFSPASHEITIGYTFNKRKDVVKDEIPKEVQPVVTEDDIMTPKLNSKIDSLHNRLQELERQIKELSEMKQSSSDIDDISQQVGELQEQHKEVTSNIEEELEVIDEQQNNKIIQNLVVQQTQKTSENPDALDTDVDLSNNSGDDIQKYYVVISSSLTEAEAVRDIAKFKQLGMTPDKYHNAKKKRYYVYHSVYNSLSESLTVMKKVRKEGYDSWVNIYK